MSARTKWIEQNDQGTIGRIAAADPQRKAAGLRRWLNLVVAPTQETVTICLLDDDPSVLKSIGRLLQSAGYGVEPFTDPQAFLEHAARHKPEVAVIDVWMSTMHGLEVQARLRTASPTTRVILLTSRDDSTTRITALNRGACAFFIKGFDNEKLSALIDEITARA